MRLTPGLCQKLFQCRFNNCVHQVLRRLCVYSLNQSERSQPAGLKFKLKDASVVVNVTTTAYKRTLALTSLVILPNIQVPTNKGAVLPIFETLASCTCGLECRILPLTDYSWARLRLICGETSSAERCQSHLSTTYVSLNVTTCFKLCTCRKYSITLI